jgi:hypothetical protein
MMALAWANVLAAGNAMPSCCKAHHCSMKKQCGIGTPAPIAPAKIYTVLCDVPAHAPAEIAFDFPPTAARRAPLVETSDIDHPPRLLLV